MKNWTISFLTIFSFLFLTIPASAHSHLKSSSPEDGENITSPLEEVILNFGGEIEVGSYVDVLDEANNVVTTKDLKIENGKLIAQYEQPLANGKYEAIWSIISADGHPVEGKFTFTVENSQTSNQATAPSEHASNSNNTTMIILLIAGAIMLIGVIVLLLKRKRK